MNQTYCSQYGLERNVKLLSRDNFREGVFARDKYTCVVPGCGKPAKDAHHILERRLFEDGGYYLENGASVCEEHHLACERTDITVEQIREYAGIHTKVIPPHMYDDVIYDKWGNVILEDGRRLRGELFDDESVQKILASRLGEFCLLVKYPRTYHLPWSPGMTDDDRMIPTLDNFVGKRVIVTEKMDGENTTMYNNTTHARSLDSRSNFTRDWVKQFWSSRSHEIPDGWRICGENLYAKHSIQYNDLESYFLGFSVWNDMNVALSWDDTLLWFNLLNIPHVPILYDGTWDEKIIKSLWQDSMWDKCEGYVIRTAEAFHFKDFKRHVAKFVRKGHVTTTQHWLRGKPVVPNELKRI
jgi:hypothetical protein